MTRYARQLDRLRADRVLDRQVGAPLPRIRPGEAVDAAPGQTFEVVVDNDQLPGVIVAGRVIANGAGALRVDPALRAVDGRLTTAPVDGRPLLERGQDVVDQLVAGAARPAAAEPIPGHPGCERLP